jgi:MFS family permease
MYILTSYAQASCQIYLAEEVSQAYDHKTCLPALKRCWIAAMLFGVFVFLIGSIGCGWAPDINVFLISRCIAGIGAGGMTGMAFLIVADMFSLGE